MIYSRIIGTGGYLPTKILTNAELESMVDTTDAWIQARTGIKQRHIAAEGETTCDMAEQASRRAMQMAGVQGRDIDLIIVATTTADQVFPATACLLQDRIGANGCAAFDVQAVCAGFVYAMDIANKFIQSGSACCALVVGSETFSRIIDWTARDTCVLFGDGAGAMILRADDKPGIRSTHLHADGQYNHLLCVPAGISTNYRKVLDGEAYTHMQGGEVFKLAVRFLGQAVDEALIANKLQKSDIDWLVPHQANIRIISATARKLNLPMDRVIQTVDRHGNTSAASIPLAFDEGVRDQRILPGQTVIVEGIGGGFAWGSALLDY